MAMMEPRIAELVLEEHRTRTARVTKKQGFNSDILAELFPQQREFVLDESRSKAVCCERRAGKTVGLTADLINTNLAEAGWDCLYLNPTAKQARAIMWEGPDGIKVACARLGVHAHFDNTEMVATMPNGSRTYIGGAEKREHIEVWRGRKFKKIIIDEAGSFRPHLEPLITEVLQPTLMDLMGSLELAGTPPKILAGLFYDAIRADGKRNQAYKYFHWSIFDNPHIQDAAGFHEWVLETNGWTRENATFRREYLGECVREDATLVYRNYDPERNGYNKLPAGINDWLHILSIDLGFEDATALRVISYSPSLRRVFLGRSHVEKHMSITRVAEIARTWDSELGFVVKVADFGGGGKQIVAEMNERFSLAIEPADKAGKASYIEMFNDDMLGGHVAVRADDPVIEEWAKLQWNETERLRGGERVMVRIEDPRLPNHLSDATLYGWREAKHFHSAPPVHVPKRGDADFAEREAEEMLAHSIKEFAPKENREWWEDGYNPEEYPL